MKDLKKFRRIRDRSLDSFPDRFWKAGYEFKGTPYPEYNQVEFKPDGALVRIHVLDQLEEIPMDKVEEEFVVVFTTYNSDGWHDTFSSSSKATFAEAHKSYTETNAKLGKGATPKSYTRAETIKRRIKGTDKWLVINEQEFLTYLAQGSTN